MRINRLVILLMLVGCKATIQTSSIGGYSEDLSVHRPAVIASTKPDTVSVDEPIDNTYIPLEGHIQTALDSISSISLQRNKEGRYVDGYVIQVYSGTSRSDANESQVKMNSLFPDLKSKITYRQPSFRVKGGKFIDRLEANRVYNEVKSEFPRALLIPERLLISYE